MRGRDEEDELKGMLGGRGGEGGCRDPKVWLWDCVSGLWIFVQCVMEDVGGR